MDDDAAAAGQSVFSNISIYEDATPPPPPPPPDPANIDFDDFTVGTYDPTQDVSGTATVLEDGAKLELVGNAWKAIDIDYTVTANTVIEFDFSSNTQGEIHGFAFDDNDNHLDIIRTFKLYGTQNFGITDFNNYAGDGGDTHYIIPVGQYYTGVFDRLGFIMDDDAAAAGQSVFSNISIYEDLGLLSQASSDRIASTDQAQRVLTWWLDDLLDKTQDRIDRFGRARLLGAWSLLDTDTDCLLRCL